MMDGGGGGIGWIGPVIGLVVAVGFFGLVAWAVLALTRRADQPAVIPSGAPRVAPDDLLAERFARGEIDADEFERRRVVLRSQ